MTICCKMGNVESGGQANPSPPDRPPKASPGSNRVYPPLGKLTTELCPPFLPRYPAGNDDDYEILRPGPGYVPPGPIRPAPKPPGPAHPGLQHQTSTHTLGSSHAGLEGVPFIVNPRFLTDNAPNDFRVSCGIEIGVNYVLTAILGAETSCQNHATDPEGVRLSLYR